MAVPPTPEQQAGHTQYLIVKREAIVFLSYALVNTILSIVAAALFISTNPWYWILIPLAILLFSAVIYTFIRQTFFYRILTSILVILGCLAAISLKESIGLLFLGINIVYFCGIASIGMKFDHRFDPISLARVRK